MRPQLNRLYALFPVRMVPRTMSCQSTFLDASHVSHVLAKGASIYDVCTEGGRGLAQKKM